MPSILNKHARIAEFITRLQQLVPASSHRQARRQIEEILNQVEDEFSGVPFDPANWKADGRMYPPQDDSAAETDGYPNVTSYRSRGHETLIAENGAFEIRDVRTSEVVLHKLGSDGNGVWS